MWLDQRGSEVLEGPECRRLLATVAAERGVGRLAVATVGAPMVAPVNFAVAGGEVIVLLDDGYLHAHACGRPVAFEVDRVDPSAKKAWSVLVRGLASPVEPGERVPDTRPMVPRRGRLALTIRPDVVSGRRFDLVTDEN